MQTETAIIDANAFMFAVLRLVEGLVQVDFLLVKSVRPRRICPVSNSNS